MARRFASDDDASDLLAGILADTESEAATEQARRAEELALRRSQEMQRLDRKREARRVEGQARLEAERQRQAEADARRLRALRAADTEPAATDATHVDFATPPTGVPDQLVERLAVAEAAQAAAEARLAAVTAMAPVSASALPAPQSAPSRRGLAVAAVFLAAAAALLVAGVATGGVALAVSESSPPAAVYARAELQPVSMETGAIESGFVASARPEVVEPVAQPTRVRGNRTPRVRTPRGDRTKPKPRFDFGGGDDPFSSKRD